MKTMYKVTREVGNLEPHNWLGRAAHVGEVFREFEGATYGSCDEEDGIVLTTYEDGRGPFFEFPRDAVEKL